MDSVTFRAFAHELLKEGALLSFGNMRQPLRTIATGVDAEAARIARSRPLLHDELPVPKIRDLTGSLPSVSGTPAASRAAQETTGAMRRPISVPIAAK